MKYEKWYSDLATLARYGIQNVRNTFPPFLYCEPDIHIETKLKIILLKGQICFRY